MKALLVIFIIYINYVICDNNKYAVKNFPKKVKPYGNGKILINSGKYEYKSKAPKGTTKTSKRSYTVFQVVGNSKTIQGVPDSPYFPVDQSYDHKPRVKKVLPDYAWSSGLRNKRSVETETSADTPKDTPDTATTKTIIKTTTAKPETTTQKTETTTQTAVKQENEEEKKEARKSSHNNERKQNNNAKTDTKSAKKHAKPVVTSTSKKPERISEPKVAKTSKKPDKKDDGKNKSKEAQMRAATTETTKVTEVKKEANNTTPAVTTKSTGKNETKPLRVHKRKKPSHKGSSKPRKQGKGRQKRTHKRKPAKHGDRGHNKSALKAERRLIAGREALIEDYPYVVSLQKDEQHWCSGALLNPRLVITTANCLWKASRLSRMEVRAGSRHLDRGGQMAGIQEVMKHPGWGLRKNPDNDVALVLLDKNIKFSDSVHAVDLPNRVMMPPFDDAWVTSWGAERRDGVYDPDGSTLQVYHTRLIDRAKCNNITTRFSVIVTENFICLSQAGKSAPCTRDTGAPAVSDGILWGLASWGIRKMCGTERFPAMFSYLASHSNVDFLTNATSYLMSDKRFYPFGDRFPMMAQNANNMMPRPSGP